MAKKTIVKEKVRMPVLDPAIRIKNFEEVALGYTEEMALEEAMRCLQCKARACVKGCPVDVPIPEFIGQLALKNYTVALDLVKSKNVLPGICGRVCPLTGK